MLNAAELLAEALGAYASAFIGREPRQEASVAEATKLVLERIGSSDALYHSAEHTALVTLVGQDIFRGERLRREVTANDWLQPSPMIWATYGGSVETTDPGRT